MGAIPPPPRTDTVRAFLAGHRRPILGALAGAAIVLFAVGVLPQILGLGDTLAHIKQGDKLWLLAALGFEVLSLASYVALFRSTFFAARAPIGWRASYQITLAGTVATKLFAAGGAGGIALTAWALRAAGLDGREVARRMASFQILLYAVFMGSLIVFGLGMALRAIPGGGPRSLTVVPAAFALGVCVLVVAVALGRRHLTSGDGPGPAPRGLRHLRAGLATVARTACEGVFTSARLLRHPRLGLLGAIGYWAMDIGALWAALRAFGAEPALGAIVISYFVGMLANVLPLPGGIGGVEGGMVGCLAAFGVTPGVALLAVLAYRAISFWLPTLPGLWAYVGLRRTVARWRSATDDAPEPPRLRPEAQLQ
jgi:uncharacterized membrane protein YbhN (UPF0104 family)